MPFEQLEIAKQPTDYNIGQIESVGNLRESQNNPLNYVLDITIRPTGMASRQRENGEKYYITFRSDWFQPDHTTKDLSREGGEKFLYSKLLGFKGGRSADKVGLLHQLLTNEQIMELVTLISTGGMNPEAFADFLNDRLTGKIIGYSLKQQQETVEEVDPDTGEEKKVRYRTEYKSVDSFFQPDAVEGLEKGHVKARERAERDSDKAGEYVAPTMKIWWEPGSEPFSVAAETLQEA